MYFDKPNENFSKDTIFEFEVVSISCAGFNLLYFLKPAFLVGLAASVASGLY